MAKLISCEKGIHSVLLRDILNQDQEIVNPECHFPIAYSGLRR